MVDNERAVTPGVSTPVRAGAWVIAHVACTRIIQAGAMIVLARFLSPSDFGVWAVITTVFSILLLFSDMGVQASLIQTQGKVEAAANFWFRGSLMLGMAFYFIVFAVAPFCAAFFHYPSLDGLLRVMGVSFLINSLCVVPNALLARFSRFREKFYVEGTATVVGTGVSLATAAYGGGVWSLVAGGLTAQALQAILIYSVTKWRPGRYRISREEAGEFMAFGSAVSFQGLLVWLINNVDNILIGRRWGARDLGLYSLGCYVGLLPAVQITGAAATVIYPRMSAMQPDRSAVRDLYLRAMRSVSLVTLPLGVGMIVTAPLFVPLLFGNAWVGAIGLIQLIAVYGMLASVGGLMVPLCNSQGRPDIVLKYCVASAAMAIPVYFLVVPYGVGAMAAAHALLAGIRFPVDLAIAMALLGLSARKLWDCLRPGIFAASAIGLWSIMTVTITGLFLRSSDAITLVIAVLGSGFVYGFALWLFPSVRLELAFVWRDLQQGLSIGRNQSAPHAERAA